LSARASPRPTIVSYAPKPDDDGAVCLVDSGIAENPDTEDAIIERTSVAGDGSSGEDVDTRRAPRHADGHGRRRAAQRLRHGRHLVAAQARRRARGRAGEDGFRFGAYRNAIQRCRQLEDEEGLPIKVILLALGGSESPSDSNLARLEDTVKLARDDGINVVAAAGNDGEDEVIDSARVDEVLAVGASEGDGGFCDFSNRGEGLDLKAPGCGLDTADPKDGDETTTRGHLAGLGDRRGDDRGASHLRREHRRRRGRGARPPERRRRQPRQRPARSDSAATPGTSA